MSETTKFWNDFAEAHADAWHGALSQLLQIDTVSGEAGAEAHKAWMAKIGEGMDYLQRLAVEMGFATRRFENRVLVIEQPGPEGAPVLGFPIHLDVVPAGQGWTREPFGGEIANGAVWGRGAQDDKGPIIQALYALHGAAELARGRGTDFTKTVRIMIFSEEELGQWDDIPYYLEREAAPDFSIVPDAAFPITVGEKGFVNLDVRFEWKPELAGEFSIRAGERANVVPAEARLVMGPEVLIGAGRLDEFPGICRGAPRPPSIAWNEGDGGVQAEFYGVGAHGSLPHKGHNAAVDALECVKDLPAFAGSPAGRVLAWLGEAGAGLDGAFLGIDREHEKVGKTTVNLGVLRVDRSSAHAVLNIRNPIGIDCDEVERLVRDKAAMLGRHTSGLVLNEVKPGIGSREPIYVNPEEFAEWIEPMRAAYTAVTGRPAGLETIGGTTFAKAFPNAVCFGPVDESEEEELAHQADEHVTLKAMRRNIEIYGRTIVALAL